MFSYLTQLKDLLTTVKGKNPDEPKKDKQLKTQDLFETNNKKKVKKKT
tara:strand:- start:1559 stop:1702 length:144 start_codon:yes stop_codon:yes gene_type:complete